MKFSRAGLDLTHWPDLTSEGRVHFGQFGEDVVLWTLLKGIWGGFFVDCGAFDPVQYSNTYLLSKFRNWSGVNLDLSRSAIDRFVAMRPRDESRVAALAGERRLASMYRFEQGAVSTIDHKMAGRQRAHGPPEILPVTTTTLAHELGTCDIPPAGIDLLSIDVEGMDLDVLRSFPWGEFKDPRVIAIETHGLDLHCPKSHPTFQFLEDRQYRLHSHLVVTSIFVRRVA